jgi:A/G-specific adenine glycosylase
MELIKLPGVGPYTAAAISSFAFDEPRAVVDGNVYRVLSRYFNADIPINKPEGQKFFQKMADELLDSKNPATHNQAIMELGALVCSPKNPDCETCPLNNSCEAYFKNTWSKLPIKIGKTKVKNRNLNYLVCLDDDQILMQQRGDKDIWANMFEFPLIEGESLDDEITKKVQHLKTINHKLTHQNLNVQFFQCPKSVAEKLTTKSHWVALTDLKTLPLPRVIEKFLDEQYDLNTK